MVQNNLIFLNNSSFILLPPSTTDEKKSTSSEPKFVIFKDPPEGNAKFLVVEIQLPGIISAKSLLLDVNEDTLLLTTRSDLYHLHIRYLPFDVIPEETLAQVNKQNQCLTVTMTVNDMTCWENVVPFSLKRSRQVFFYRSLSAMNM